MDHEELLSQMRSHIPLVPPNMQRDLGVILHKLTYPMMDILAQVPGDSLSARAKKLKVSRQTMYVWQSEKFRPTLVQARRIAKATGVPLAHIVDNGFEEGFDDTRRKARKKAARMAKRPVRAKGRATKSGQGNRQRRVGNVSSRNSPARKVRKRSGGRPDGAERSAAET